MKNRIDVEEAYKIMEAFFNGKWEPTCDEIGDTCIRINGSIVKLFIVAQGKTYNIESARGHLFSPRVGYPNMYNVEAGDIIISVNGAQIKSLIVSLESAEETYGVIEGLRIDCLYNELEHSVDMNPLRLRLGGFVPFNKDGKLPQRGYIHPLSSRAAWILRNQMIMEGNTFVH